jgi:hypothetical protein
MAAPAAGMLLQAIVYSVAASAIVEYMNPPLAEDPNQEPSSPPPPPPPADINNNFDFSNTNTHNVNNYNTYNFNPPSLTPPPSVVYVPTGTGSKPEVSIEIKDPPSVPNRRLPKEADGQTDTPTPKKRSISIKQRLTEKPYGGLLTHPVSTRPIKRYNLQLNKLQEQLKNAKESSTQKFANWLTLQQAQPANEEEQKEYDELAKGLTFWDTVALIAPESIPGLSGKMGLLYGMKPLAVLASAYQVSRANAYQEVTGYVPLKLTVENRSINDATPVFLGDQKLQNAGLGAIRQAVGANEFPIAVPRSLIQHTDAELDKILDQKIKLLNAEKGKHPEDSDLGRAIKAAIDDAQKQKEGKSVYRTIENIPQQISWMVQVLDEVLGSFPVGITLADSDLIKVGEEEQKIRVPNIAEALAELTGMALLNHSATELSVNMLVRILCETGTGRQQSIKNYYLLDVIRDYLGCATKEKTIQAPFAYDPVLDLGKDQKDEFAKFLTPKMVDIDIEELDEKHSLSRWLVQIDSIYALCRAYMTRPARDKNEVYKYLKDIASQFVPTPDPDGTAPPDEFDQFLERVETGFTTQAGNTLENQPYGREYTERPRVVRLTKKNDAEDTPQ